MTTPDPVSAFSAELDDLRARAEQIQQQLQEASATVSSPDGAVTVKVGPSGALLDLSFGSRAYQRPPNALSALVMQLIGSAQQQVSSQVSSSFAELVGEDSAAMEILREFVPESEEDTGEDPDPDPGAAMGAPEDPEEPAPAPPQAQEQPPARRPRPRVTDEDDDDFSDPW
ncbi:YbaB/EbfC family nucleoid-associated protein [Amycolatopsis sp. K13G38]|uniref:YbaB/EbfC family nucleoid-associated protein n=1 Tax=Amycolatopsis acididurans TaxID=2724524 RepID=A0ABX1JAD2_9PSEU|nr:YbaB/EbfC family nucleoid-associated protein [Amycolatopsis acididurans]NKQ56246.1 YbaB/EbfC family nucleoid-associated protein [Amycolatopsis acididurans]